jgi:hypothetical protein
LASIVQIQNKPTPGPVNPSGTTTCALDLLRVLEP